MPAHDRRFSDEKLVELCVAFEAHSIVGKEWREEHDIKMVEILKVQEVNAFAIANLTTALEVEAKKTKDIVQLHQDLMGAARVGASGKLVIVMLVKAALVLSVVATGAHLVWDKVMLFFVTS